MWTTDNDAYRMTLPSRAKVTLTRDIPIEEEEITVAKAPSTASKTLYLVLGILPLALVATILFAQSGILTPAEGTAVSIRWDISIVFLSLVVIGAMGAFVARRAPELRRRAHGEGFDNRLSLWELRVMYVSLPLAGLMAVAAFGAGVGWFDAALGAPIWPMAAPMMASVAILLICAPLASFTYVRQLGIRAIESSFPDFLRDLNEANSAGMTMAQAIRVSARGDYGRLNRDIRRMAHQVSWGTSFPHALKLFAERVGTPVVARAVALIIKATNAGGSVRDVLAAAARDARDLKGLETDRRMNMMLYTIIIYVAFGVFLAVTAALQGLLIPAVLESTSAVAGGSLGGVSFGQSLTLQDFRFIYFAVGIIQAFGSGIVAGAMSEGSLAGGLKHSSILVAITLPVLAFL